MIPIDTAAVMSAGANCPARQSPKALKAAERRSKARDRLNLADRSERAPTRVRPRAQSPAKATVVMIAFSAWRESSRVCWTTIGTSDSITLA